MIPEALASRARAHGLVKRAYDGWGREGQFHCLLWREGYLPEPDWRWAPETDHGRRYGPFTEEQALSLALDWLDAQQRAALLEVLLKRADAAGLKPGTAGPCWTLHGPSVAYVDGAGQWHALCGEHKWDKFPNELAALTAYLDWAAPEPKPETEAQKAQRELSAAVLVLCDSVQQNEALTPEAEKALVAVLRMAPGLVRKARIAGPWRQVAGESWRRDTLGTDEYAVQAVPTASGWSAHTRRRSESGTYDYIEGLAPRATAEEAKVAADERALTEGYALVGGAVLPETAPAAAQPEEEQESPRPDVSWLRWDSMSETPDGVRYVYEGYTDSTSTVASVGAWLRAQDPTCSWTAGQALYGPPETRRVQARFETTVRLEGAPEPASRGLRPTGFLGNWGRP